MTHETLRARVKRASIADKAMLVLLVALIGVGVIRLAHVATVYPRAMGLARAGSAAAPDVSVYHAKTLADFLDADPVFAQWWGHRIVPRRQGHDYLLVMTQRSGRRTLGPALGTIVEQLNAEGAAVDRVVVPLDNDALVGGEAATFFTTAEGEQISAQWASVAKAAARFTTVPIEELDYDPVLTDEEVDRIEDAVGLTTRARGFRVGDPQAAQPGTWVLFAHPLGDPEDGRREFLLVPAQADPRGVAR